MSINHVDVAIVGAGLSGIGAACHLEQHSPTKTYAIIVRLFSFVVTCELF
jgi:cation diffusion facilitator CzcD-associated flavoprotein CzcO